MRLRSTLSLLLTLGLSFAPALPAATEAPSAEATAPEAASDAPAAPTASVQHRRSRGDRRPGTRPTPRPPQDRGGLRDHAFDRWMAQELRTSDQLLAQGRTHQARDRLYQVSMNLWRRHEWRYRHMAEDVDQVIQDVDYGRLGQARGGIRHILANLGNGGGQDPAFGRVVQDLQMAVRYLDRGQTGAARRYTLGAYNRMVRSSDMRLRQELTPVRQADLLVAQNRPWEAASILRGVLLRLGNGGGGGGNPGGCRRDRPNRMEWRRDLFDLIDTIQDGNIRMAQRDLRTLIRDIRQDGYDWNCNRAYVQRLQFVGQRLTWGNEHWVIQQLRALRQELNF